MSHLIGGARLALLKRDLDEIVTTGEDDFRRFAKARLYVTGGTGFVGTWFLRAVVRANERLATKISVDVLTRHPQDFAGSNPDLATAESIRFLQGDIVAPVCDGTYDGVVHLAATSGATVAPNETIRTIVDGTRAVIREVIAPSGAIPVLFVSSGAVYGRQPTELDRIPERYCGEVDQLNPRSVYSESKRLAELSFVIAADELPALPKIARLFAFLGPGLPLDQHFAAGNFLRDALRGGPIRIKSGGTAMRTYLYPSDMIAWCLAIFSRGQACRAYNVGSDDAVSIEQLAQRIAGLVLPRVDVELSGAQSASTETRYAPDVTRITNELGVRRSVELDEAITRTLSFHRDLVR